MFSSTKLSYMFFLSLIVLLGMKPTSASYKHLGEEDVLFTVSKKLNTIEQRLNNQSVLISPESLNWPEIEEFNKDLMYVVAHDPHGPPIKETPVELNSDVLTERLFHSWTKLEASVLKIGTLVHAEEWTALKTDMEQFFAYRKDLFYQPARVMIKTGQLSNRLANLRTAAAQYFKDSQKGKKITFKVSDPVLEELAKELKTLNVSVRAMEEFRRPKKAEVTTIFQTKNFPELSTLAAIAFAAGLAATFSIFGIIGFLRNRRKEKVAAVEKEEQSKVVEEKHFDYDAWLRRFEKNIQTLKRNEDNLVEDVLCLSNYCVEVKEARHLLNEAVTQEDHDNSLLLLNAASSKMEEYFEKINLKKNSETSKNIMKHLIELCEAIENGMTIKIKNKSKPALHVVKPKVA